MTETGHLERGLQVPAMSENSSYIPRHANYMAQVCVWGSAQHMHQGIRYDLQGRL